MVSVIPRLCKWAKASLPYCAPGPDLWKAPPPPDPSPVPGAQPAQPSPASAPRQGLTFQALSQAPSGGDQPQTHDRFFPRYPTRRVYFIRALCVDVLDMSNPLEMGIGLHTQRGRQRGRECSRATRHFLLKAKNLEIHIFSASVCVLQMLKMLYASKRFSLFLLFLSTNAFHSTPPSGHTHSSNLRLPSKLRSSPTKHPSSCQRDTRVYIFIPAWNPYLPST